MSRLEEFTKGELVKLVTEEWVGRVTVAIIEAIDHSFDEDRVIRSVRTRGEIERRFEICIRWFVELRRELHWSVPRILDALPIALRSALDGIPFDPDEGRDAWHGGTGPTLEFAGEDIVGEVPDIEAFEAEEILS